MVVPNTWSLLWGVPRGLGTGAERRRLGLGREGAASGPGDARQEGAGVPSRDGPPRAACRRLGPFNHGE